MTQSINQSISKVPPSLDRPSVFFSFAGQDSKDGEISFHNSLEGMEGLRCISIDRLRKTPRASRRCWMYVTLTLSLSPSRARSCLAQKADVYMYVWSDRKL